MASKLRTFTLALKLGKGRTNMLFIMDIISDTFENAAQDWARITGHFDELWDVEHCTYFNFPVVETKQKAIHRSDGKSKSFFSY